MKKTATILAIIVLVALSLAACGNNAQEEKTGNEPVKNEVKIIQTEKSAQNVESGTEKSATEETKPTEETTPPAETQTPETPASETQPGQEKITVFKGEYVTCRLPEKWASQEDLGQGVAAQLLDPTTGVGVVIQFRKDNTATIDEIVTGTNRQQLNGTIDDYKIGAYSYKRITKVVNGLNMAYLFLVKGTMAYYVSTSILDSPDAQLVLSTLELK